MHFSEIEECSMTNIDTYIFRMVKGLLAYPLLSYIHPFTRNQQKSVIISSIQSFYYSFKEETIKYIIHKYFEIRKVKNKIKSRVNSAQNT